MNGLNIDSFKPTLEENSNTAEKRKKELSLRLRKGLLLAKMKNKETLKHRKSIIIADKANLLERKINEISKDSPNVSNN